MVDVSEWDSGNGSRAQATEPAMETLESAIYGRLDAFLSGALSLEDFTAWLVGATWNIEQMGNTGAIDVAFAIELALAEHSSGLLTLEEFRTELRSFGRNGPHDPITR